MNIVELFGKQKAYTFAKISKLAYEDNPSFYGFQSRKISIDNNVVFVLYNDTDIVVVSRGTELDDFRDVKADAMIRLVPSLTGTGYGHHGFETATKDVWEHVTMFLKQVTTNQNIWFTGHSLGAAMSHIMAVLYQQQQPEANIMLYTFGSPRVGDKRNTSLGTVEHHRYVDSADIVPRIPTTLRGYRHYGTLHYLNTDGKEVNAHWGVVMRDRIASFFQNPANIIEKHFIEQYITQLGNEE
jgi:triacylglycerol lipase